jgi:hypothetical protein
MLGGGWMLLVGLLFMLTVIGVPILLIVLIGAGVFGLVNHQKNSPPNISGSDRLEAPLTSYPRYCSHCGQGLQMDWTHCPKCGSALGMMT